MALLVAVAYARVFAAGFIWDDDDYVTQNETLRSLAGLARIWTEPGAVPQYYPLVHTAFWIEFRLWGLAAAGYHAVNVALHALGAVLLWRLLLRLRVQGALLAAAIFAVHPAMVESVAWITERKNCLSMVFLLGALHMAARAWSLHDESWQPFRPRAWLAATALFACALLSKTVTASFPAAVLVLLWWRRGRIGARDVAWTAPWFALGAGLGALTIWMEKTHVGAQGADFDLSLLDRAVVAGRACWFYAWKLVLPLDLAFIYPRWDIAGRGALSLLWPATALALPAALFAMRAKIGRGPLAAVLLFGGTLFPALGFIDVYPFVFSFVADHFQYHASAALIALAAAGAVQLVGEMGWNRDGWPPRVAAGFCIAMLGAMTFHQTRIYRDMETLWRDTLARNPDSWMPHSNLGLELDRQGRHEEAVPHYARAVELRGDDPVGRYNLGTALLKTGRVPEAVREFEEAVRLKAEYPAALFNLGVARMQAGDFEEAAKALREGLALAPDDPTAHAQLARVLAQTGDAAGAEEHLRRAAELQPGAAGPLFDLAQFLMALDRPADSAQAYAQALEVEPESALRVNYANVLVAMGRIDDAVAQYRRVLQATPDDADTHFNLATVLLRAGRRDEAIAEFEEVVRIAPGDEQARRRLAELK